MKKIIILSLLVLSGCAVGPLTSHETARTVGDGNHEIVAGFGQSGFVGKWSYGLKEDLDIGVHLEFFSIGLRAKYAFLNSSNGFSLAGAAGIGDSLGGGHYYGELLTSYMFGTFEPFVTGRFVRVKTDPVEFGNDADNDEADFTINSYKFNYVQVLYGTRIWINPNWLVSVEGATFAAKSSGLSLAKWNTFSAALGYRF